MGWTAPVFLWGMWRPRVQFSSVSGPVGRDGESATRSVRYVGGAFSTLATWAGLSSRGGRGMERYEEQNEIGLRILARLTRVVDNLV